MKFTDLKVLYIISLFLLHHNHTHTYTYIYWYIYIYIYIRDICLQTSWRYCYFCFVVLLACVVLALLCNSGDIDISKQRQRGPSVWNYASNLYQQFMRQAQISPVSVVNPIIVQTPKPWMYWSLLERLELSDTDLSICMYVCNIAFITLRPRQNHRHLQTTFSYAFSWMKMYEFRQKYHWGLFPRVHLTITQHWFK